jgi:hypothetical protein
MELGISLTALKSLCRKLEVPLPPRVHTSGWRSRACAWQEAKWDSNKCTIQLTSSRNRQISRWPFRQARWISARVRKDLRQGDIAVDIQINEGASTSAQHSNVLTAMQGNRLACDAVSQRELDVEMCPLFSSMPLKHLTYYDQNLDRALQFRFDEGDMPDLLPSGSTADLFSVCNCNTPPPTAQEQEPTNLLTPTRRQAYAPAGDSDAAMRYGQVQRASHELGGSRVQRPSWFDPFTATDEADSELAEMMMMTGYTECDLSYLNVFS